MPLSDFLKRSLVAIAALVWLAPPLASAQVGGPIGGGPGGGFGGEIIPGVDWEARLQIDQRLRHQDRRIDRQGAMSAAMLNMATSAAGVRTQNRVGVGVGFQGGESALSLGYQRALSERATVTLGGAFSSDDSSVGVGAGFGW